MKIKRDGKWYTLTADELADAAEEFVTNWMENELRDQYDLLDHEAEDIAKEAYALYCKGNGKTQYECIEKAYQEFIDNERGDD